MLILICATIAATFWWWLAVVMMRQGQLPALADQPLIMPMNKPWPRLAVLIAARNEEAACEQAIRSILALDYPELTVVAVDDRSTDGTWAILERLRAEDARLRTVRILHLPDGWLGKNHALETAAARAPDAEWLLLTDADIHFDPAALKRAVAAAASANAQHVTIFPQIEARGAAETIVISFFGLTFSFKHRWWRAEDLKSRDYLGIGAFNMIKREAFEGLGGMAHLRLSVDEDTKLGQALKAHGFRTKVMAGRGQVRLRWYEGPAGYVRGFEKNAFASVDYNVVNATGAALSLLVCGIAPHWALLFGNWSARLLGLAGLLALALLMKRRQQLTEVSPLYALGIPLGALVLVAALVRSTVLTLRQRGVKWRDHLYPLDQLRQHVHERNQWIEQAWQRSR